MNKDDNLQAQRTKLLNSKRIDKRFKDTNLKLGSRYEYT